MPNRQLPSQLYQGYIFDLDGTLYLENSLLPGAAETLRALRQANRKIAFISNNPTYTRQQMVEKLNRLGIPAQLDEIVHSSRVMVAYLQERAPGCTVFPVGEQPLIDELAAGGFVISDDPKRIDFVIASFDRTFHYAKLQTAFDALRAGARLVATNADRYCPTLDGGQPDAASVIAAIEACTGIKNEIVVGKPSLIMARTALEVLGLPADQVIITGDRLETDILMGKQAGMATALVLTGVTKAEHLAAAGIAPDFILDRLDQLLSGNATANGSTIVWSQSK